MANGLILAAVAGLAGYLISKRDKPAEPSAPATPPVTPPATPPVAPATDPAAPATPPAVPPATPPATNAASQIDVNAAAYQQLSAESKAYLETYKTPLLPHTGLMASIKKEIDGAWAIYPSKTPYNIVAINWALNKCTPFITRGQTNPPIEKVVADDSVDDPFFGWQIRTNYELYKDSLKGMASAVSAFNVNTDPTGFAYFRDDIRDSFLRQWYFPACRIDPSVLGAPDFAIAAKILLGLVNWRGLYQPVEAFAPISEFTKLQNDQAMVNGVIDFIGAVGGAASFGVATPLHNLWANEIKQREQEDLKVAYAQWLETQTAALNSFKELEKNCTPAGFQKLANIANLKGPDGKILLMSPDYNRIMTTRAAPRTARVTQGGVSKARTFTVPPVAQTVDGKSAPLVAFNFGRMFELPINCIENEGFQTGGSFDDKHRQKLYLMARAMRAMDIIRCQIFPVFAEDVTTGELVNYKSRGLYSYVTAEGICCIGSYFPPTASCKALLRDDGDPFFVANQIPRVSTDPRFKAPPTRNSALADTGGSSVSAPPQVNRASATDGSTRPAPGSTAAPSVTVKP
jgi:hypothetical protein